MPIPNTISDLHPRQITVTLPRETEGKLIRLAESRVLAATSANINIIPRKEYMARFEEWWKSFPANSPLLYKYSMVALNRGSDEALKYLQIEFAKQHPELKMQDGPGRPPGNAAKRLAVRAMISTVVADLIDAADEE